MLPAGLWVSPLTEKVKLLQSPKTIKVCYSSIDRWAEYSSESTWTIKDKFNNNITGSQHWYDRLPDEKLCFKRRWKDIIWKTINLSSKLRWQERRLCNSHLIFGTLSGSAESSSTVKFISRICGRIDTKIDRSEPDHSSSLEKKRTREDDLEQSTSVDSPVMLCSRKVI